ncbi:MAG: hypothetical protein Kow0032_01170 [Methyloligellaceae bacterium]
MIDPFSSAKSVLRRADKHIAELEREIKTFTPDKPYTYVVEKHADGVRDVHKLRFSEEFSSDIACILFDAVMNLRACLDQIAFAVARLAGHDIEMANFPFASGADTLPEKLKGLQPTMPPEIIALFAGFKPYKGGDNTLWALNYIRNIKTHAILVPVSFGDARIFHSGDEELTMIATKVTTKRSGEIAIQGNPGTFTVRSKVSEGNPSWDPHKNEITLMITGPGADIQMQTEFTYSIVIHHSEKVIDGQPPVPLLNAMRGIVERILMATEAECRRIGLIS